MRRTVNSVPSEVPSVHLDRLAEFCYDVRASKGEHAKERTFNKAISQVIVQIATVDPNKTTLTFDMDGEPQGLDVEMARVFISLLDLCEEFGIHLDDAFKARARWEMDRGWV